MARHPLTDSSIRADYSLLADPQCAPQLAAPQAPAGNAPQEAVLPPGETEGLPAVGKGTRPPPRRITSADTYERAWAAYQRDASIQAVMKGVPCGREQGNQLVYEGLPKLGLPPLEWRLKEAARLAANGDRRLKVSGERLDANQTRVLLEERKSALLEARRRQVAILGDAVGQVEEEARLARANRQSALVLAGIQVRLLGVSSKLAAHLEAALEDGVRATVDANHPQGRYGMEALRAAGLNPREVLATLRVVTNLVKGTAEVSQAAVELERTIMGEPSKVIGMHHTSSPGLPSTKDMTVQEAEEVLAIGQRALARRRAREVVVDGEVLESGPAEGEELQ